MRGQRLNWKLVMAAALVGGKLLAIDPLAAPARIPLPVVPAGLHTGRCPFASLPSSAPTAPAVHPVRPEPNEVLNVRLVFDRYLSETENLFDGEPVRKDPQSVLESWRALNSIAENLASKSTIDPQNRARLEALERRAIELAGRLKVQLHREVPRIYEAAIPFQTQTLPKILDGLAKAPGVYGEAIAPKEAKGSVRVRTKLGYAPDAPLDSVHGDSVLDYARGTVLVDSLDSLASLKKKIETDFNGVGNNPKIIDVRDYFAKPHTNGYRGLHFLVQDPTTGLVWEMQVRLRRMNEVSQTIGHKTYEEIRTIKDLAKRENRELRDIEKQAIEKFTKEATDAYDAAYRAYLPPLAAR